MKLRCYSLGGATTSQRLTQLTFLRSLVGLPTLPSGGGWSALINSSDPQWWFYLSDPLTHHDLGTNVASNVPPSISHTAKPSRRVIRWISTSQRGFCTLASVVVQTNIIYIYRESCMVLVILWTCHVHIWGYVSTSSCRSYPMRWIWWLLIVAAGVSLPGAPHEEPSITI